MYDIQHCFICRPSDSTVPEDAGIEPTIVATTALAVRRSNRSARSHPPFKKPFPWQHLIFAASRTKAMNTSIFKVLILLLATQRRLKPIKRWRMCLWKSQSFPTFIFQPIFLSKLLHEKPSAHKREHPALELNLKLLNFCGGPFSPSWIRIPNLIRIHIADWIRIQFWIRSNDDISLFSGRTVGSTARATSGRWKPIKKTINCQAKAMTTFPFCRSYCWIHGTGYIRPFKTNKKTINCQTFTFFRSYCWIHGTGYIMTTLFAIKKLKQWRHSSFF